MLYQAHWSDKHNPDAALIAIRNDSKAGTGMLKTKTSQATYSSEICRLRDLAFDIGTVVLENGHVVFLRQVR